MKRIIFVSYGLTVLASVILGLIYLFSPEFMPYHSDALSLEWEQVFPELQILLIALMRVAGGGFLCVGVVVAFMLVYPFRADQTWSRIAIPMTILSVYIPALITTLSVTMGTPASAPWQGPTTAIGFTVLGANLDFNRKGAA